MTRAFEPARDLGMIVETCTHCVKGKATLAPQILRITNC
jgi:hypothetical protein